MQQSAENDREKAAPSAGEGIKTGLISASGSLRTAAWRGRRGTAPLQPAFAWL